MEYNLKSAQKWTACTGTSVTGIEPGVYQMPLALLPASMMASFSVMLFLWWRKRNFNI